MPTDIAIGDVELDHILIIGNWGVYLVAMQKNGDMNPGGNRF